MINNTAEKKQQQRPFDGEKHYGNENKNIRPSRDYVRVTYDILKKYGNFEKNKMPNFSATRRNTESLLYVILGLKI